MKRILIIVAVCLAFVGVSAQDIIIFGQVLGANDGQPLQAANVWFKNTQIGTATNEEGYFILRCDEPQKTLCVSVLGYRHKEVKLSGSDEVLTIYLKEEHALLSDVLVVPGENEAIPLIKRVRAAANQNSPENSVGFSAVEQTSTRLSLTNIRRKSMQRRLLADMMSATISVDDSTLFMPLYDEYSVDKIEVDTIETLRTNLQKSQKTLQVLPPEQISAFLQNYAPNINFYRNNVTVMQTNFISPLSMQSSLYYQYFLIDSIQTDSSKTYYVRYRPKNDKELAFKGELWIDSATMALTHIKATLSPAAAINYLNGLTIEQTFVRQPNGTYYYDTRDCAMSFSLNLFNKEDHNGTSVIYRQTIKGQVTSSTSSASDSTLLSVVGTDSLDIERQQARAAIDSLNQSKMQRIAYGIVDFVLTGYVHAWKFDLGPLINWVRYNQLEGFRPTLQLRTGEKMMEHFTIGGYFGYGVRDKQWKYGGELQARWGENYAHTLGLFYDNDVVRYGYQNADMVNENMYGSPENLLTTCSFVVKYDNLYQIHKATAKYQYENKDWRFTLSAQGTEFLSNKFMPFVQNNVNLQQVRVASVTAALRFAYKEKTIDRFFYRYHLTNKYPVVSLLGEYGYYMAGSEANHYGQVRLSIKESVPLFSGRLKYAIETGYIFGNVPWMLLETPRIQRNFWSRYDFGLLTPMEFMTDAYVMTNLRYTTSGWIFNYIPYIKKMNMREVLIFQMAYGGLRSGHDGILTLPESVGSMQKLPYIEAGVGICNILRLISVESIWRVTYRNTPDAIKWGIRCRLELGL